MVVELLDFIRRLLKLILWDLLLYPFMTDLLYGGLDGGFNWGLVSNVIIFAVIVVSFYVALYRTTHLTKDERVKVVSSGKKND